MLFPMEITIIPYDDSAQCQMYDNQKIINYAKRLGIGIKKIKN